jgi:hypothetical protein
MIAAALNKMGSIFFRRCPLFISLWMNSEVRVMKFFVPFWCQYWSNYPMISPLKQLWGWADSGGM